MWTEGDEQGDGEPVWSLSSGMVSAYRLNQREEIRCGEMGASMFWRREKSQEHRYGSCRVNCRIEGLSARISPLVPNLSMDDRSTPRMS